MNLGKTLFAQLMEFVPWTSFARIVARYSGDTRVSVLPSTEHFRIMAYAQLTWRESLRDIEVTLGANATKLYAMGLRQAVQRSTLADANERRDWRIWADFAAVLIRRANKLYADEPLGLDVNIAGNVYALDSSTIDLCLSLFDWAPFRTCDQSVALHGHYVRLDYPEQLRRVRFKDPTTGKTLIFLTNNTTLPAAVIARLYKNRWQVELFFKWIKQHLRIKRFLGNSEIAVKTQVWCAIATYVLIAIVKKELQLKSSLYTCLQILSVSVFEKTLISCALQTDDYKTQLPPDANQLILFGF